MTDEEAQTPLEKINEILGELVNNLYAEQGEGPVIIRGGVIAWESMTFNDDGEAMFSVNYAALPNTSMASVIGILDLGIDVAKADMFPDDDED